MAERAWKVGIDGCWASRGAVRRARVRRVVPGRIHCQGWRVRDAIPAQPQPPSVAAHSQLFIFGPLLLLSRSSLQFQDADGEETARLLRQDAPGWICRGGGRLVGGGRDRGDRGDSASKLGQRLPALTTQVHHHHHRTSSFSSLGPIARTSLFHHFCHRPRPDELQPRSSLSRAASPLVSVRIAGCTVVAKIPTVPGIAAHLWKLTAVAHQGPLSADVADPHRPIAIRILSPDRIQFFVSRPSSSTSTFRPRARSLSYPFTPTSVRLPNSTRDSRTHHLHRFHSHKICCSPTFPLPNSILARYAYLP